MILYFLVFGKNNQNRTISNACLLPTDLFFFTKSEAKKKRLIVMIQKNFFFKTRAACTQGTKLQIFKIFFFFELSSTHTDTYPIQMPVNKVSAIYKQA